MSAATDGLLQLRTVNHHHVVTKANRVKRMSYHRLIKFNPSVTCHSDSVPTRAAYTHEESKQDVVSRDNGITIKLNKTYIHILYILCMYSPV